MDIDSFVHHVYENHNCDVQKAFEGVYGVRDVLVSVGITDSNTLNAAILRDVIVKFGISKNYLELRFGKDVAEIVDILSGKSRWKTHFCATKAMIDTLDEKWIHHPEVVLIKMAERNLELRSINHLSLNEKIVCYNETQELLLPFFRKVANDARSHGYSHYMQTFVDQITEQLESTRLNIFKNN